MLDEILNINKPLNWTSFDVCNYLKKFYPRKTKIGHAGTLDPLATGVLVVAVGNATKKIPFLMDTSKVYEAEITFGATTESYDAEIYPEKIEKTEWINEEFVNQALKNFVGEISQTPPKFSALKIDGKRAYDLARSGQNIEMKPRQVTIDKIDLIDFNSIDGITKIKIIVTCQKGVYIRSLAHDLGQELGVGAFLSNLKRLKVGEFDLANSVEITSFDLKK